jgi:hypothetical protein
MTATPNCCNAKAALPAGGTFNNGAFPDRADFPNQLKKAFQKTLLIISLPGAADKADDNTPDAAETTRFICGISAVHAANAEIFQILRPGLKP